MHYQRHITPLLEEALADTPAVLLTGPRQAGKTTLARQMVDRGYDYVTLDDELTRLSAQQDPVGFIRERGNMVIDEIQRAPELLLAIKMSIDDNRKPGRFLLTGSANILTLPKVADSLAGRMESFRLLPLSQSEIVGNPTNWIDFMFAESRPGKLTPISNTSLVELVCRGGYPEAVTRTTARRRQAWARQYLDAIIQRDVQDIGGVEKLAQLPRLVKALGHTAGQMCNYSRLAAELGIDGKTAAKYIGILEQIFLVSRIQPWSKNQLSRLVKTPKLQFLDTGILTALLDLTPEALMEDRDRYGHLLENFVVCELLKHNSFAERSYDILYYRDQSQVEIDVVIEDGLGNLLAVEIKASATVRKDDLKALTKLRDQCSNQFKKGILLYDGDQVAPLGDRLWAVPIASLWGLPA
jgi:uncharacterized protein